VVDTPAFMPVGTYGTVKGVLPRDIAEIGAQIILGNTFHLWLRPGTEVIAAHGDLHDFMQWQGPILTDSGGFQVFSLGAMRKISEEGVAFRSPVDGAKVFLDPETSMAIQRALGSDIVMIFDECTPYPATHDEAGRSMELSLRWAARSRARTATAPRALRHRAGRHVRGPARRSLAQAWSISALTATRSAACPWASPRRRCSRCWTTCRRRCPRIIRAISWGRYTGGSARGRASGCRHVRLRDADAPCAQRLSVHVRRRGQDPQRPAQAGHGPLD
jgi:hypothetical protein